MADKPWTRWVACWEEVCERCLARGGRVDSPVMIDNPASEEEIAGVEEAIGRRLPSSFRRVLREFCAGASFEWSLPEHLETEVPGGLSQGGMAWCLRDPEEGLVGIAANEEYRRSLVRTWEGWGWYGEGALELEGHLRWRRSLMWLGTGEDEGLGFDGGENGSRWEDAPVVLLDSVQLDDDEAYLGANFIDFMNRWSSVGCVGPASGYMRTVMPVQFGVRPRHVGPIDPHCEVAREWREWMGCTNVAM